MIFETYNQVDTVLLYLDLAAKKSLESAIYCFMKNGLSGSGCGDGGAVFWSEASSTPSLCDTRDPEPNQQIDVAESIPELQPDSLKHIFNQRMKGKIEHLDRSYLSDSELTRGIIDPNYDYSLIIDDSYTEATGKASESYVVNRMTLDPELGVIKYTADLSFRERVAIPNLKQDHSELKSVVEVLIRYLKRTGEDSNIKSKIDDLVKCYELGGPVSGWSCFNIIDPYLSYPQPDLDLKWKILDHETDSRKCSKELDECTYEYSICDQNRDCINECGTNNNCLTTCQREAERCVRKSDKGNYTNYYVYNSLELSIKIASKVKISEQPSYCTFFRMVPDQEIEFEPDEENEDTSVILCSEIVDSLGSEGDYEYRFKVRWKKYSHERCCAKLSSGPDTGMERL